MERFSQFLHLQVYQKINKVPERTKPPCGGFFCTEPSVRARFATKRSVRGGGETHSGAI